jgi:hypothetical protein
MLRSVGTFRELPGFSAKSTVEEPMAFYNGQPRDPSAIDARRSSSNDVVIPLLVTMAIMALVVAGIYFASEPARVADTGVGPVVTQLAEPSAPPPRKTQRESRPTQAPIP